MSDFDNNNSSAGAQTPRKPGRRKLVIGLVGALLATLLIVPFAMAGKRWGSRDLSPEQIRDRVDRVSDRVLSKLDASDEQRTEVDTLVDQLLPGMIGFKAEGRALKAKFRTALTADTIDAQELENLRQEGLALADRASAKALGAVISLAEILTPEQRAELQALLQEKHERMRNKHHH